MPNSISQRISTGIAGFDEVLGGGLISGRTYLLTGPPGGGKTTVGWHFLIEGVARGESVLFVTFGEREAELRANAEAVGLDTNGVSFCDLSPSSDLFRQIQSYDIFAAAEVELQPTTQRLVEAVEQVKPVRVFVDSMTALRYLAKDPAEFRRQTLSFSRYLLQQGGCIVMTSETGIEAPDDDLRYLCDGVIEIAPSERARSLEVTKFRGSDYRAGRHTLRLGTHGATVFPRLIPDEFNETFVAEPLSWGNAELDALTHGGLERGTITLLTGPSGVGKTTVGMQFMKEAASRGERSAIYSFDEPSATLVRRCEQINMPVRTMIDRGTLSLVSIEALKLSPDEFANIVRRDVEDHGTKVVMIDSISGYRLSVSGEDLTARLHALCRYLQNVGVTVLLVNELINVAEFRISEVGISYLADNVVFLRYVERLVGERAEMGRVVGVLKKRLSDFEKSMRPFEFTAQGVQIGECSEERSGIFETVASLPLAIRS